MWRNRVIYSLILDGNSILNRAFYGIRVLSTKEGFHTNAIYGFLNILNKLKNEFNPEITVVAFDLKAPTFRHKYYNGYKATRKSMPAELAEQLPVLKDLLIALGYNILEKEGYEADDILGTLAKLCELREKECIIATGDRDALQLISKYVSVNIASAKLKDVNSSLYTESKIFAEYGVSPKQLIEVKALAGDTSDNISGVRGIGSKTALSLIQKFGSIDYIYNNIDSLNISNNIKQKLINGKDSAYLSKYLGTIVVNVPISEDLNSYASKPPDALRARKILEELEMFSVIKKFNLGN